MFFNLFAQFKIAVLIKFVMNVVDDGRSAIITSRGDFGKDTI